MALEEQNEPELFIASIHLKHRNTGTKLHISNGLNTIVEHGRYYKEWYIS